MISFFSSAGVSFGGSTETVSLLSLPAKVNRLELQISLSEPTELCRTVDVPRDAVRQGDEPLT